MNKTFLEKELDNPLTHLRVQAHSLSQNIPAHLSKNEALKTLEELERAHTHPELVHALQTAHAWIQSNHIPSNDDLKKPSVQCAIGLALFLNDKLSPEEKRAPKDIESLPRIQEEQLQAALLCSTFLGNHSTKIAFGKPGTWFYYNPSENKINIDMGQALLLGLENSRGILLHEIGHSLITLGRTPKIEELQKKMADIEKTGTQKGMISRAEAKEYILLKQEWNFRENAFQYMEDAAVNTFAEEVGKTLSIHIPTALLRTYTVIGLSRKEKQQDHVLDQILEALRKNPETRKQAEELEKRLKEASAAIPRPTSATTSGPKKTEPKTPEEKLKNLLTHLGNAYPLEKGYAGTNLESSHLLGLTPSPEGGELQKAVVGSPTSSSHLQPRLQLSLQDRLNPQKMDEATTNLFVQRGQTFDHLFDQHLLPLVKSLPEPDLNQHTQSGPTGAGEGIPIEPDPNSEQPTNPNKNPSNKSANGPTSPAQNPNKSPTENPQESNKTPENTSPEKPQGAPEPKETKPGELSEGKSIAELLEDIKIKAREQLEGEKAAKRQWQNLQKQWEEGIKNSASGKDIFDEIPPLEEGKRHYEGVQEVFREHIKKLTRILEGILLPQKINREKARQILPDPILGVRGLQISKAINSKIKENTKKEMDLEDFKYWDKKNPENIPSVTNFIIHMDLTGSMNGDPARVSAITAIALKEALKKYPQIRVFATASQGGKPQLLMGPQLHPDEEKKLLGGLLETGDGNGDNEIDAVGLQFSLEKTLEVPTKPKERIGKTHFLVITDGGVSHLVSEKLPATLKHLLQDPLVEFDILIVDGSTNNNLCRSVNNAITEKTIGRRTPQILVAKKPEGLFKEIALHYAREIRKNPVFLPPRSHEEHRRATNKHMRKIQELGLGMH
jgi:hypothetical protein